MSRISPTQFGVWILAALAAGYALCVFVSTVRMHRLQRYAPMAQKAHFYRFEVQPGSEASLGNWIEFERENHRATVATLEDEAMYVEAIFPDDPAHPRYLYWLAFSGTPKQIVSPKQIDDEFRKFEAAVLVKGSRVELAPGYLLVAPFVQDAIYAHVGR